MSKETALRFFSALTENVDLKVAAIEAPAKPEAWVALAKKNGFEFSDDELCEAVRMSLGRSDLDKDAAIVAFLASTAPTGGELSDATLDGVSGGTPKAQSDISAKHRESANGIAQNFK